MTERSDPRLTEERLRNHLDSNQVQRERLCLALLPLLGPFTRERPRRPKGGPDGGRDIEALHQGSTVVWGAVGFRNGGGNDDQARATAIQKFKDDLTRAREENPSLTGFVFFTNVDLTPTQKEELVRHAAAAGFETIEVFDFEILRHALDSPEGLIARLQYLDIPMSPTEQASLVNKFGAQLQTAVTSRFDRVERTLAAMERFLDLQKPIIRLDTYVELRSPATTEELGEEAILLELVGLHDIEGRLFVLLVNHTTHSHASNALVVQPVGWVQDKNQSPQGRPVTRCASSVNASSINAKSSMIAGLAELSVTTMGGRVALADAQLIAANVYCTAGLRPRVSAAAVDANGYELIRADANSYGDVTLEWPDVFDEGRSPFDVRTKQWVRVIENYRRNFLFSVPERSPRFADLFPVKW